MEVDHRYLTWYLWTRTTMHQRILQDSTVLTPWSSSPSISSQRQLDNQHVA